MSQAVLLLIIAILAVAFWGLAFLIKVIRGSLTNLQNSGAKDRLANAEKK